MGLVNYWVDSKDKDVKGKQASFMGKDYAQLVEDATGVSLYQGRIDNQTVAMMATTLERRSFTENDAAIYDIEISEYRSLVRMFRRNANAGNSLISCW